ncbi:MAG: ABC transporter ATP-binding protein [Actinomycetia bacterium]|nr:ABC transporter ATP-binding protein [Actinomycetes bacterium]
MLEAVGLTKSYGDVDALEGADLVVDAGQIVSLLGRNGAGKTTLLSIVAGLLTPDSGQVRIGGIDVAADPVAAARQLGIAPQETGIYRVLTVAENLRFFGELAGVPRSELRHRVTGVADQLGLGPLLDRRADQISGGEARRLHTACALVHRPRLLMLDEPTVGADVATRNQLIDAVKELADDGAAVVYTTHYLPEVVSLGADIVIIEQGRILSRGTRRELIDRHRTAGLLVGFAGTLPVERLADLHPVEESPGYWRLTSELGVAELVGRLGPDAAQLTSVEALQPDLETVFLAVTGRSLDTEPGHDGEEATS